MTKTALLFKYQEFMLFVGLSVWLSILHITDFKIPEWSVYFKTVSMVSLSLLPSFVFIFNKTKFRTHFSSRKYLTYWLGCFFIVQPCFTAFCMSLALDQDHSSLFITAATSAIALELLLTVNFYYQNRVKDYKWFKKIGLENSVLISLVLISLVIAAMGASSINNPAYHNKDRLLIGFEFSLIKIFNNFGTFLAFFIQFLFIYLCGYLFFILNSKILVSNILKQKGLIMYILSALTTIAILYPIIAQILIVLPINKTLGRAIFSDNPFDLENAFGAIGVMLCSLPIVLAMQWGKQNTHILSLEKEKSQTELDLLKQQLNPHFFFNTLNNLYSLSLQQSEKTPDSILRLSELMRYTIYKGQQERVSLLQELNYIEDYIQLQQIRLKKSLSFTFEQQVLDEDLQVPPLLLIVLIENAFKHGIEPAEHSANLNLFLKTDTKKLYFSCKNSVEEVVESNTSGIGLLNLQKRLALLYPGKHVLKIKRNPNQFTAELEITL